MKRKLVMIGVTLILLLANMQSVSAADGSGDVEFTSGGSLVTSNSSTVKTAFKTMAPGETRVISFNLTNNNSNTANFYVDAESLQELTAGAQSAGAAYNVVLSVTKGATVTNIYSSSIGGSSDSGVTTNSGLTGIKALGDSVYLVTLSKGESAVMNFTLTLDGVINNTYQSSIGDFNFLFSVAYDTVGATTVDRVVVTQGAVTNKVLQQVNDVIVAVKTGDTSAIGVMVLILAAGIVLLVFSLKKKGREEHYESVEK